MATNRVRVAAVQYYIRPVDSFDAFQQQVTGLVATAADYKARLMVFPEYFTLQLLTLQDVTRPAPQQVRQLASQATRFVEMMAALAKRYELYIAAGSIPLLGDDGESLFNQCFLFSPTGACDSQGKMHMTRWESEDWNVSPRQHLRLFDTEIGKLAITICYDAEFPELARAAAREGCYILIVPSCTDDRQGFWRVRYCAHARAIENQMYVIHAPTVGSLPMVPAVSMNYGSAAILTPSDFQFARDGILAEGNVNQEMMVIGDLNIDLIAEARENGTVLPLRDSQTTAAIISNLDWVHL